MEKLQNNTHCKPFSRAFFNFMILGIALIMCINLVSAGDWFGFDNYKKFEKGNLKYGKIDIYDRDTFTEDDLLSSTTLEYNTDACLINCEARGKTTFYEASNLISELKIYLAEDTTKLTSIEEKKMWLKTGEKNVEIIDYEKVCIPIKDGKVECTMVQTGTHMEKENVYSEYNGKELDIGTYEWKITGKKRPEQSVDWVISLMGKELDEWAYWNSSFDIGLLAYYHLDENSGTDAENAINGINNLTAPNSWTTGKSGSAINFSGSTFMSNKTDLVLSPNPPTEFSFSGWVKFDSFACAGGLCPIQYMGAGGGGNYWVNYNSGNNKLYWIIEGGGGNEISSDFIPTFGQWYHIGATKNAANTIKTYINGIENATGTGNTATPLVELTFGRYNTVGAGAFRGTIDEVAIYNRSLSASEMFDMYNGGTGIFYDEFLVPSVQVFLNSPQAYFNTSLTSVLFNCSATAINSNMTNLTLEIDGVTNFTLDKAGIGDFISLNTTVNGIPDGIHNWTCRGGNNGTEEGRAMERNFAIDTSAPIINITVPYGNVNYHISGTNLTINWTVSDSTLDTCIFEYAGTNTTSTCTNNGISINVTSVEERTARLWANDSFNNIGNFNRSWNYSLWQDSNQYSTSTAEGATEVFVLNGTILPGTQISTATLVYNNTNYAGTINNTAGNNYSFSRILEIPSVTATINNTFYWNIVLEDSTEINTTSNIQEVVGLTMDDCSANPVRLYNFSIISETTQLIFNPITYNTSSSLNVQLYTLDRSTLVENFSSIRNGSDYSLVCLSTNLSGAEYSLDAQIQYNADGYASEFYNIQNSTITQDDTYTNITLYDLIDTESQEFVVTFKDSRFLAVADALIQVQRKYVGEGVFKTVEIPITDADGSTVAHLELADAIYTFIVTKHGEVLGTFENVLAVCQDIILGNCDIKLNAVSSETSSDDFTTFDDLTMTLTYNQSSRTIRNVFTVPSGAVKTLKINATLYDALGNTQICSDELTSSSGTLSCVAPTTFGNGSMVVTVTSDGETIAQPIVKLEQTNKDIYGSNLVFLTLFLYLTLIGVGISDNPMITGFFVILGAILATGLNLVNTTAYIGTGATILWLIILVIMILVKGGKRG